MKNAFFAALATLLATLSIHAFAADVTITKPWAKGTLPSATVTSVFMEFVASASGEIVAARSPQAASVDMLDMRFKFDGGPLRPEKLASLPFEANRKLQLTPVTQHFQVNGLKASLKAGDVLPLILTVKFSDHSTQEVRVEARARALMP